MDNRRGHAGRETLIRHLVHTSEGVILRKHDHRSSSGSQNAGFGPPHQSQWIPAKKSIQRNQDFPGARRLIFLRRRYAESLRNLWQASKRLELFNIGGPDREVRTQNTFVSHGGTDIRVFSRGGSLLTLTCCLVLTIFQRETKRRGFACIVWIQD